jgi:hypothetical protein
MHVSTNDFFRLVDLGEKHAEVLRSSILNGVPVGEFLYPVGCAMPLLRGEHLSDWMVTPYGRRDDGNRLYVCLIAGFAFTFVVGSAPMAPVLKACVLRENGSWLILRAELSRMPALQELFMMVVDAERSRKRGIKL